MQIRLASADDTDRTQDILKIYDTAREYMIASGNPRQWDINYPNKNNIEKDRATQALYLCLEEEILHAVFTFAVGNSPVYDRIEGKSWLNNEAYMTLGRLASDGVIKGLFEKVLFFCIKECKKRGYKNLRADTYKDNKTMQYLFKKYGFEQCGIVRFSETSTCLAYHLVLTD